MMITTVAMDARHGKVNHSYGLPLTIKNVLCPVYIFKLSFQSLKENLFVRNDKQLNEIDMLNTYFEPQSIERPHMKEYHFQSVVH